VPFFGAKVYPTDIEEIINSDPDLARQLNSFQISSYEDESINRRLKICLETVKDPAGVPMSVNELHQKMFDGLCRREPGFPRSDKDVRPQVAWKLKFTNSSKDHSVDAISGSRTIRGSVRRWGDKCTDWSASVLACFL
jgi:phenylacetate-CoA ligase